MRPTASPRSAARPGSGLATGTDFATHLLVVNLYGPRDDFDPATTT